MSRYVNDRAKKALKLFLTVDEMRDEIQELELEEFDKVDDLPQKEKDKLPR